MTIIKSRMKNLVYAGFIMSLLTCCCWFSSIVTYDSYSYNETTAIKDDVFVLMNKAGETFTLHEKEVEKLKERIIRIYVYENTKCKNQATIQQWEVIKASKGSLYQFFDEWKQKSVLNTVYAAEMAKTTAKVFDNILELELKKRKQ